MIDEMFEDAFDLLFSDLFQVNDFTVESFNISVLDLHWASIFGLKVLSSMFFYFY